MSAPDPNHDGVGVEVRGLKKSFNNQEVLKGLDFKVNPGEIFVIMGPSGSGKSVLLKQIIGLDMPDAGEIFKRLVERHGQLLVVARVDGGPDVRAGLAVQVGVAEERVHLGRGHDKMGDQAPERRKGRAVAVAQASLVQQVDEIARPLRHRAEEQDDVRRRHLLLEFHGLKVNGGGNRHPGPPP